MVEEVLRARPVEFSGERIECRSPATGELLGEERAATVAEVELCVARAAAAQRVWARTDFDERRAVLHDLLDMVLVNRAEIARATWLDTGKSRFDALMGEVASTCEKLRHTIRNGETALRPEARIVPTLFALGGKYAEVQYAPLGVVGCIVPWNYPFHNFLSHAVSALFCGNAVLVKSSEWATYSRRYYLELFQRVLRRRGHAPELVQLLPGYGATGAALVASRGVAKVLFIGSPEVGAKVMAAAAATLKPVILELGGKDPFIVLDPCDLETAVDRAINGAFFNLGQNCISAERMLVQRSLYAAFCQRVQARCAAMRQGIDKVHGGKGDVDVGAMTMPAQRDKVRHLVADAQRNGARLLSGGELSGEASASNMFMQPTVLCDVNERCALWREEAFGPVMLIIPVEDEREAVAVANACRFGLGASVACNDLARAERVAKALECGMVVVNDYGLSYMIQDLPFGGWKDSGFGRFNGPEGLREFCNLKSFVGLRWTSSGALGFPHFLRRPYWPATPEIIEQILVLFYGWGLAVKAAAVAKLVKLFVWGPSPRS